MKPPLNPGRRQALVLIAALLGWMFDGLEMGLFPLVARPALQEMQAAQGILADDRFVGTWMGIITAAFLLGAALGGGVFGWLGDRIGRVRALSFSILCYSLFTGLTYFAHTPWELTALRFIAALGMGGEWSLGVALVMEVWPEKHRPVLAGVIGASANAGFALIALVGIFFSVTVHSWRWVVLIGALPALLTFFVRLFVPESEKWQHAAQSAPSRPLREALAPALRRNLLVAIALTSIALIGTWGSVQWLPLWADQLTGGLQPQAKAWTGLVAALGAMTGCFAGAWAGGHFGRRPTYFLMCLSSLVVCTVLFRGMDHYGAWFLGLTFLAGLTTASFYGWMPLYLPELFPTRVRATGQGLAYNSGRIFAAIGALQMGVLMREFGGSFARAGAVVTLIYVLGLGLIWLAPETKGRPLPA
ncbi:MAG: MFS transporter [Opitutaceae bacterium]|nr:MFS transporter [Opitutaceae bacterium]MBP9914382.1 MFS transporter [Opitutaceae bacterium]